MHRLLLALGLITIAACTSEEPEEVSFDAGQYDFEGICREGEGDVPVVGQWAGIADFTVHMLAREGTLVALCPNPQEQPAELIMRVELTEGAEGTTQVELQLCDLQLPTILGAVGSCPSDPTRVLEIAIFASEALSELLPLLEIGFDSGLPTSVAAGSPFEPDSFVEILGVDLADPFDPLPFWDTSREGCSQGGRPIDCVEGYELLTDDDGDENLGVTLEASTGEAKLISGGAYVTIRLAPRLFGSVKNDLCIEGNIAMNLEFTIVDSDLLVGGLNLSTPLVIENIPPLDFLESSRFKLLRADGPEVPFDDDGDGVVTCAEIRNNRGNFLR